MTKIHWVAALALTLTLLGAGAAWGAPVGPAGGEFSVFIEQDMDWYDSTIVGIGCGIGDNLTVGGFYVEDFEDFGAYANLALGPVHLNAEIAFLDEYYNGMISALYVIDRDPLALGLGGGFDFAEDAGPEDRGCFVSLAVEVKAGPLSFYGAVNHYLDEEESYCKIGCNVAF